MVEGKSVHYYIILLHLYVLRLCLFSFEPSWIFETKAPVFFQEMEAVVLDKKKWYYLHHHTDTMAIVKYTGMISKVGTKKTNTKA